MKLPPRERRLGLRLIDSATPSRESGQNSEKNAPDPRSSGRGSLERSMSRRSQARAKAQSRRVVRGERARSGAISSRVRPAKKRSLTSSAACGLAAARRVRASSRSRTCSSSAGAATSASSRSTRRRPPPCRIRPCGGLVRRGCGAWPRPRRRRSGRGCSSVVAGPDQPQVRLVDQGRGLERLAGLLLRQLPGGQLAQLVVDQRQQLLGRAGLALLDGGQDPRDVVHRLVSDGRPGGFPDPGPGGITR